MRQIVLFNTPQDPTNASTSWLDVLGGSNIAGTAEANVRAPWPAAGTFRNFVIHIGQAPGATKSWTYTIVKNGVDTPLTVTISDLATSARLTGTDLTVAAGDTISLKVVPSSTPASSLDITGSIEFESTTTGQSGYAGSMSISASGTRYNGVFSPAASNATTPDIVKTVVAADGTITAMYGILDTAPIATQGVRFYINKNGTRQDGSGGTVNTELSLVGTAAANVSFSLPVVGGDILYLEIVAAAGGDGSKRMAVGVQFTATTDGESQLCGSRIQLNGQATAQHQAPSYRTTIAGTTTETVSRSNVGGPTSFTLSGFRLLLSVAPGSGKSRTFQPRKDATNVGASITISDSATSGGVSGSFTVDDGNLIHIAETGSGTPAVASAMWAFIMTVGAPPPNSAPTVDAGPDQSTQPGVSISMAASASDDGNPNPPGALTYAWTKESGPGTATFSNAAILNPTVTFSAIGTYVLRLTVSDSALSAFDELTVTVTLDDNGDVPAGTNPAVGNLPSDTPQYFGVIEDITDGTILEAHAESDGGPFNDDSDYYGGFKDARIVRIDAITRKATTPSGGIQATTTRIVLNDADRHFRDKWGVSRLRGRKWSTYLVDHADRLAKLEPYRVHAGIITDHGPIDGRFYELVVQGMLGRYTTESKRQKKVPQNVLTPVEFPVLAERHADGFSPPIGYGYLDDESSTNPQGVCKGEYVGSANLQTIFGPGAVNVQGDFYVFFGHAVASCLNAYYTVPAWTSDTAYMVGDVIRPTGGGNGWLYKCTTAGTSGASAPTFPTVLGATVGDGSVVWENIGADDTSKRYVVPADAWGQIIIEPHMPGWTAATGSTLRYVDYNGYRYTVAIVRSDHRFAKSLRENSMVLSANFRGIDDVGDGTGALITSPARIIQHFWTNFIVNSYKTGAWFPVPNFGAYSLFDTTTVEATAATLDALAPDGHFRAAIQIGLKGQQTTAFDALRLMAESWDIRVSENRHGQITLHTPDPAAVAAVTFDEQQDAITFEQRPDRGSYANVVRWKCGYLYVPPIAQVLVDDKGQPLPTRNTPEAPEWASGLKNTSDTAAITVNDGEEVPLEIEFWGIRDQALAQVMAERLLARAVGPTSEGPVRGVLTTGLQGLRQLGTSVDIGTVIGVNHPDGLGVGGSVNARFFPDQVELRLPSLSTTLEGLMLHTSP